MILTFPRHKLKTCDGACLKPYSMQRCPICEWGAAICETCGGAEGELPRDCPQRKMTAEEKSDVHGGRLEYTRIEGWHRPQPRCVSV